jgi:hypothetical protein
MNVIPSGPTGPAGTLTAPITFADSTGSAPYTVNIDCSINSVTAINISGNTTFNITNPPTQGLYYTQIIVIKRSSSSSGTYTLTFPSSITWSTQVSSIAPASISTAKIIVKLITYDAGQTWLGSYKIY